jgi:hypothetical protein
LLLMGLSLAPLLAAALLGGSSPNAAAGEPCDEHGTRELVTRFIRAFNSGNVRQLDAVFARGMWWRWYSVGSTPGRRVQVAAYNRTTLIKYFRARHKQRERLVLRSFQYNGWSNGFANFQYELTRIADDMRPRVARTYVGKGAVSCFAGKLAVWSMGQES